MEKYIISKEIGSGSFGKIYVVEAKRTGIQYVVKQIQLTKLSKKQRGLAEKEIQVLSKLKHGNIVRYREAYADDFHLHIIMELCERGDLHGRIQVAREKNSRFTDEQVMEYFVQICLAVEYIHNQRIIHRDIKTKNIFLTKSNVVKIGDFGVSKMLENSFEFAQTCIGSPFYVSPEICENQPYDKKCDVWSIGCVLFEITTLRYAFTANNMKALLQKIAVANHNPLPANTNRDIKILLGRLLRTNPKQRPTVTDVLSMPYVQEYRKKLTGRCCCIKTSARRSRSGDDLGKISPDSKSNNTKTIWSSLRISKSTLNLNSSDKCVVSDITQPEMKYSKIQGSKLTGNVAINGKDTSKKEKISKITSKIKKLQKSDCQYLKLLENKSIDDMQDKKSQMVDRDRLETDEVCIDIENKVASGEQMARHHSDLEEIRICDKPVTRPTTTKTEASTNIESSCRKRWTTTTADRDELITILSDASLMKTEQLLDVRVKSSIDDLLAMGTTDLSHIPILQPSRAVTWTNDEENKKDDLIFFGTSPCIVDDRTFVIRRN